MKIRRWLLETLVVFSVTLAVSLFVSVTWSLVAHGKRTLDWETSFRFAILFGLIVPWITARTRSGR
jgi:hypothetical protein